MTLPIPPHIRDRLEARKAAWARFRAEVQELPEITDLAAFWNGGERARELALEAADRNREQSR